ncbi:hypothetical protein BD770DRAFT_388642 [Pilaira anomala]|nr:hypothetical protein BD770DRAFT_388642 [Pilaira anomala]
MTTKSSNPFQSKGWNYLDKLGESSYMPHYYEDDMNHNEPMTPPPPPTSFRSLSPSNKIYHHHHHHQKIDYFTDFKQDNDRDELQDDCDGLYEAMLMNSNFLSTTTTTSTEKIVEQPNTKPINRLTQILNHLNPTYYRNHVSPLSQVLSSTPSSIRSQFSSSSSTTTTSAAATTVIPMVAFSMPDPRDTKGKGKFKPNI